MVYSTELEQGLRNFGLERWLTVPSNGYVDWHVRQYGLQHPLVRAAGLEHLLLLVIYHANQSFERVEKSTREQLGMVASQDQLAAHVATIEQRMAAIEKSKGDLEESLAEKVTQLEQLIVRVASLEGENAKLRKLLEQHLAEHRAPAARLDGLRDQVAMEVAFRQEMEEMVAGLPPEDAEEVKEAALRRLRDDGRGGPPMLPPPGRGPVR